MMDRLLAATTVVSAELWYRRLEHINSCDLNKLKKGMKDKCVSCCEGKQVSLPVSHVGQRSAATLHTDVCAMEINFIAGLQYFLLFVDDYSRMNFKYVLKYKSEIFQKLKRFLGYG